MEERSATNEHTSNNDNNMSSSSDSSPRIAVVGATGAVGIEIVDVLHRRGVSPIPPSLYASRRSAGKVVSTSGYGDLAIEEYDLDAVRSRRYDAVLLAVSGGFALEHARRLAAPYDDSTPGPWVIDNSSALRLDDDVPLVVPEVNAAAIRANSGGGRLIANPNCTTAIAAMVLWPLHRSFGGIKKCIMSTYQAASGAGAEGMEELKEGCAHQMRTGEIPTPKVFARPLPFNVIPHIDAFQPNDYTKEEMKVTWETRKIFGAPDLSVSCTAVRVPTLRAHSESITIELGDPATPEAARSVLRDAPGVAVVDDPSRAEYPTPLRASGRDDVEVGRIRQSLVFGERGLDLFVVGDQLLRGAALNAVLILETVLSS